MLVYNEAEIIDEVIREYYNKVASKLEDMEFIVAEDGSTDGTKEILDKLAKDIPITLYSGKDRKGYVQAYKDAMSLPKKEVVFFSDSSGKHDPEDFWGMYELIDKYDIVSGYKKHRKDPFYRILLTKGFNTIVNLYFGIHLKDIDSGFKIMTLQAVQDVIQDQWIVTDLISFEVVVRLLKKGYTLIEIPVSHSPRKNGSSRGLPAKKIPKVIWRVLCNFPKIKKTIL
jgi:glycosyltransferase involved in cell wall biosynthesis